MVFIVKCAYCIIFKECVLLLLLLFRVRFVCVWFVVHCALFIWPLLFLFWKELTGCANADTRCSLVFSEQQTLYARERERPNVKIDLIKNGKSLNEIWTKLTEPHPTCFSTVPIAGPIVPCIRFLHFDQFFFLHLFFVRFISFCFVRLLLWLFESSVRTYMINLNRGTQCTHTLRTYLQIFPFGLTTWKYIISIILFRSVHAHRLVCCTSGMSLCFIREWY